MVTLLEEGYRMFGEIQHRAIKLVKGLRCKSYDRLSFIRHYISGEEKN